MVTVGGWVESHEYPKEWDVHWLNRQGIWHSDQGKCILTMSKFKKSTLGSSIPHFWLNPTLYLKCCAHQEPKETVVAKARESLLPHADPFKETKAFQLALSWSGDGRPLCRFPRRWVRCCYHRNYCCHLLSITPNSKGKEGSVFWWRRKQEELDLSQDEDAYWDRSLETSMASITKCLISKANELETWVLVVCCDLCW